ncbi:MULTISPECIES: hypothetical protein [Cysteiniphilum]|uniref:Uncharacterized protein n=1 Tax=Cysteiniphilum litorale TaxID=2056700 RepID=A0A8J3E8S5_9GAMM|nr:MULTISPECIES: hypothetical protein [Cysteiniphilum]GGG01172.1 hypothetical protein GCM10010995_18250 [Cysteiniphilum litorale]
MINYQLKDNGGNNKNDCLLIAIGRLGNPDLKEQQAVEAGWQAVFNGVDTMSVDYLQMLYTELKDAYSRDIENIGTYFSLDFNDDNSIALFKSELKETFGVDSLSQDIIETQLQDKVKQEVNEFLNHLKQQKDLQKYVELLKTIPEDKKQHLMLVSGNDLESRPGQVYEQFRELILSGKVPHFMAHKGGHDSGHYSNIVPTKIDYELFDQSTDPEQLIKQAFVNLMNDALLDATGFTHPEVLTRLDDNSNSQYTLQTLDNDLKFEQDMRQAKSESAKLHKEKGLNNPNENISSSILQSGSVDYPTLEELEAYSHEQEVATKLESLLAFVDKNIDKGYINNSRYTYQLTYEGNKYNVPWSLMQAYDSRTFGSYDSAKVISGLKADLEQENSADIIAQKLKAPMYGRLYNNTYGVSKEYLECLKNSQQFNDEVILTVDEKKDTWSVEKNNNEFSLFNPENQIGLKEFSK